MNEKPCCGNCKFWLKNSANLTIGWCRKYPPKTILIQTYDPQSHFPEISFDGWCGEHRFVQNDNDKVYADLLEENGFAAAAYWLRNK